MVSRNASQAYGATPSHGNIPNHAAGTSNSWEGGGHPAIPYAQQAQVKVLLLSPTDDTPPHHSLLFLRRMFTEGRLEKQAPASPSTHRTCRRPVSPCRLPRVDMLPHTPPRGCTLLSGNSTTSRSSLRAQSTFGWSSSSRCFRLSLSEPPGSGGSLPHKA